LASAKMDLYAAEIYRLQEKHDYVPLSILAERMEVSLQAASGMLKRLLKAKLVTHQAYKGVRLTDEGEHTGLLAIRRHRIIEVYLTRIMGFGWDEVHEITDHLHMGVDQAVEDRMDKHAGFPQRCPHGEPIPDRDGVMPRLGDSSLVTLEPESKLKISRVRANEPEKLRYFADLGLWPGTPILLVSCSPFNGPIKILVNGSEHVLGYDLASTLWVEPAG
jgi:DtxR family Mn-dependent transcriptional regulator